MANVLIGAQVNNNVEGDSCTDVCSKIDGGTVQAGNREEKVEESEFIGEVQWNGGGRVDPIDAFMSVDELRNFL